jgi:hypothetical protein
MSFAKFIDAHGPEAGAIASFIFIAAVELACGFGTDDDAVVHFARSAACSFLTVAALLLANILRFEHGLAPGVRQQR